MTIIRDTKKVAEAALEVNRQKAQSIWRRKTCPLRLPCGYEQPNACIVDSCASWNEGIVMTVNRVGDNSIHKITEVESIGCGSPMITGILYTEEN